MTEETTIICKSKGGFTLIEVLIALVLMGTAIFALLMSSQSFSQANGAGLEMSTAEFLTEQIREQTVAMTFANLVSTYNNTTVKTYSPPHDSQNIDLTAYPAYSQKITGKYVLASDLSTVSGSATAFYRITVDIYLNNTEKISSASWLRAGY
ncbi:MAG: prepilin-type N-terminal cleavage/methylation domain-containing protein [Sedimentisphaerales bacterium]|nr:prepilin-type N-terminal cleavage/methylation domain-containing protein [Sedimentisphaerales bacterium]